MRTKQDIIEWCLKLRELANAWAERNKYKRLPKGYSSQYYRANKDRINARRRKRHEERMRQLKA